MEASRKNRCQYDQARQGDWFLQTDPIGSKDDLDLYAYVGGDPVNKSDPTGLQSYDPSVQNEMEMNREIGICGGDGDCIKTVNSDYNSMQGKFALGEAGAIAIIAVPRSATAAYQAYRFSQRMNQVRKILQGWKETPNKKGEGGRFQDPADKGNRVRVDKGNPDHQLPSQREDHVVEQRGGKTVDSEGNPIEGDKPSKSPEAHQPLSDWLNRMLGNPR